MHSTRIEILGLAFSVLSVRPNERVERRDLVNLARDAVREARAVGRTKQLDDARQVEV